MVITNVNQVVYQGDGVTTAFPFTFRIIDWTDIKLLLLDSDGTETDITSDYYVDTENDTVHYPGYAPGAEPALSDRPPVLAEGQKLVIYRKLPITQEKDLGDKWPFYVIELALDKLTMILQDIWDWLGRCLYVSKGQAYEAGDDFDPTVPLAADKVVCGNENGTGFVAREAMMEVNGAWDGEGRQIKGVADPADNQDAATKNYVDTLTDGQFMKLQPDGTAWEGRNLPISNVGGPVLVKDAATKDYVDRILEGYSGQGERFKIFDNVEQMKVADLISSQVVATQGYTDINDGGAAVYTIRTKTQSDVEDGGSIIFLDNGNVAELIIDSKINVKNFGAKGDAVTDDTTAIQNAINFAHNKAVNYVLFPKGIYLCTSSLTLYSSITLGSNVIAQDYGGNVHGVTIRFDNVSCGIDITNIPYVSFENLTFDGNNTSEVLLRGGFVTKALNCNFRGATVAGFAFSGDVMTTDFKNCSFSKNYDGVITDADLSSMTTVTFENCWVRENSNYGYNGDAGSIAFYDCVFESNYLNGVNATSGRLVFEHCWFEANDMEANSHDAYKGFHVNCDNVNNGYFLECFFGSINSVKPLYSSNLTGQIMFKNCRHTGLNGLSPVFSDAKGVILFKNSFGDLNARGYYANNQKWFDVVDVDYRYGHVNWMRIDNLDYIDITFDPPLYTEPWEILLSVKCSEKMTVGFGNTSRTGFRIYIYDKPTSANANIVWTVNAKHLLWIDPIK